MLSYIFLLIIAFVYLCNGRSMVPPSNTLFPRDAITDCQNVTQSLDESCWDVVPPNVGMETWLDRWNKTTETCQPGEMWANCFMRLASVPSNASNPIRCDLIGPDTCPVPGPEVFKNATAPVGYGVASIYALQQYMTSLYQYLGEDEGVLLVNNGFLNQTAPRSVKPILLDILNEIEDPIAGNLTTIMNSTTPKIIGQPTWVIPSEALAPEVVGQTVGYLLQWMMKDWTGGGFTALATEGNLIALVDQSD